MGKYVVLRFFWLSVYKQLNLKGIGCYQDLEKKLTQASNLKYKVF